MPDLPWNKLYRHTLVKYGYGGRLNAFIELLDTRNYETGKVTQSIRSIADRFGITKHAVTEIIREVEKQARTVAGQQPDTRPSNGAGLQGETGQQPDTHRTVAGQDLILAQKKETTKYSLLYEKFWPHYPKNNGSKKGEYPAFKKSNPNAIEVDDWIEAIELQKAYKVHMDSTGQFFPEFPFLRKWIKEERWQNKPVILKNAPGPTSGARKPFDWVHDNGEQEGS